MTIDEAIEIALKYKEPAKKLCALVAEGGLVLALCEKYVGMVCHNPTENHHLSDHHPDNGGGGAGLKGHENQLVAAPRPAAATKISKAVALKVANGSIMDTFNVSYGTNGEMPIGEVLVRSYAQFITKAGRRAWVSAREMELFRILDAQAKKQGFIPPEARTRDVFTEEAIGNAIAAAAQTATKRIEARP